MRLALIGCNDDSLRLVRSIAASHVHALISIHHADGSRGQLGPLAPEAIWSEHWESLLVAGDVDAVIVCPHDDSIVFEDQCRKLVQAAVPIIASHPIGDSLFAYELEMMREEARGNILAYFPGCCHPAFARLAQLIREAESSEIGAAEQLVIERHLPVRNRAKVLHVLAQDITLQRRLIGQISSINAVGAGAGEGSLSNLAVSVTGTTDVIGRWSVGPATDGRTSTITLVGSHGTAVVTTYDESHLWTLRIGSQSCQLDSQDDASCAIEQLQRAIADPETESEWEAICHDLDATEQIDRSLRRKRTIELRRDAQNEEGAFKGIMSAGGCLVLILALLLLVVIAIVEGFRMPLVDAEALRESGESPPRMHLLLRLWPVYPLAAFLLLQLLLLVTKKPKHSHQSTSRSNTLDDSL